MSGGDVRTLQADLTKAGFRTPTVGIFGPTTERNVKSFERKYHLAVNGLVTAGFVRKLQLVITGASNADSTPGVDSTGPEGTYLAMFKNRRGLAPGKYKVTVMPPLTMPGGAQIPEEFKNDPYMAQMALGIDPGMPQEQSAGEESEFEVEIPSEGGEFDFDVKASAK